MPSEVAEALDEQHVSRDLLQRPSREVTLSDLAGSDLVLGLAREHVRAAAVLLPEVWPRAFTLKELVRRGSALGPRRQDEPAAQWIARAHLGRDPQELLGRSEADDVADPIGLTMERYLATAQEITGAVDALLALLWPAVAVSGTGAPG